MALTCQSGEAKTIEKKENRLEFCTKAVLVLCVTASQLMLHISQLLLSPTDNVEACKR